MKTPIAVAIATGLLFCQSLGLAQSGVGVSPPRVELSAVAGSQVTQVVNVDNPSTSSPLDVTVAISDALMGPEGNIIWVPAGSHQWSLAPWLSVNALEFTLEAAQSRSVTYSVNVPTGVPDGTYWTVMFFDSTAASPEDDVGEAIGISSRVRVGHIIYVDVGQPTKQGTIVGIRYDMGEDAAASVRVLFSNTGTGLLRLSGTVEVRDKSGSLVHSLRVEDEASFPGATHEVAFRLPSRLPPGSYTVLAALDYGSTEVLLGDAQLEIQ